MYHLIFDQEVMLHILYVSSKLNTYQWHDFLLQHLLVSCADATAVVSRASHTVYGMNLHVQFAATPKSVYISPQFYNDRLRVSGIPPGVDAEFFGLFLERATGIDEDQCDIHGPLDGSILMLFKEELSESSECLT